MLLDDKSQVTHYLQDKERTIHGSLRSCVMWTVDTGRVNISPVQTSLGIIQSEKDSLDS